jgi:Calx-beta domain-containing protein
MRLRPLMFKVMCPLGAIGVLMVIAAPAASGKVQSTAAGKPVIGKPVTVPAQPLAGKRFSVSYPVTRSDTGAPLTSGKMICDPSVTGKVIPHAESFRAGTARLTFVVPTSARGKVVKVKVTIRSGGQSATRVSTFAVQRATTPSISIGDVSAVEGSSGTTTLSFPVTLSAAGAQTVTVAYATADATAKAGSDYNATSGTLTFNPGEKAKTISVGVVGDTAVEQDETFTVALSSAVNATIGDGVATGTIANDDTATPVTAGAYQGLTQNGSYVFFTVTGNRTVTGFRLNNVTETCTPGARVSGSVDFGSSVFPIDNAGRLVAEGSWAGSDKSGDIEWTSWYAKITGVFGNATSVNGTIVLKHELNYRGQHFQCSSGDVTWSASLHG